MDKLDAKTSALLVMDYQTSVVDGFATDKDALLARTAELLAAARRDGVRIIYIVVGFRAGYPEIAPTSMFRAVIQGGRFAPDDKLSEVHAAVAPKDGDVIVTKHRVSAFYGTDLDIILRANGITTLVLAGIATSGVVLSTVRHAADADYRIVVVEDCCADRDAEVHRVLCEKVFARMTTVMKASAVIQALDAS